MSFDMQGLRSLSSGFWLWERSCTQTANCSKKWKEDSGGFRWKSRNTAALHFERHAVLSHGVPRLKVRSSVRSSVTLIFDISYGVHCVTIKDGDNLEMPFSIYTWRVSMR